MQKFSEFVDEYKQWKASSGKGNKLTTKEVKKIREAYESMNSRKVPAKKMAETTKPVSFQEALAKYSTWKKAEHGTDVVTLEERQNLRRALRGEKLVESKKTLREEECKCALCNSDENVTSVKDYVDDVDTGFEAADILGVMGDDVADDTPVCEACIKDAIYSLGADIEPAEKESFEENKDFAAVVSHYREWKKEHHNTARLTENEKKLLKEKFFEKKEDVKEDPRLAEAVNKYSEWKKAHHNSDKVTESEKKSIAKSLLIDDVKAKITEAKKCLHEARVHMQEGDQMDAAAATMDAGAAINDAANMGMDPNATAGDPTAMATPLPQNIVDEISAIKTSVDALATEAGIESPVDLGADANAGVPAVTGVEDPNAMPADPNAMAAPAAPAAPMAESISRVKARLADRESKLNEGLYSNKAMKDGAEDDLVKVPSTKDLIGGTKSGILKAAAVWPTKEIAEPKKSGLKNVEESVSPEAEQAKSVLNEDGNFCWDKFLKLQRGNN